MHPLYLMSHKRRSAHLRAQYSYFRQIWLAEWLRAATETSRGGPGSETAWDGRNHAADGLPLQSRPSVRQGRSAPCIAPVGRGAVCWTARTPGSWSSRSVSGKRCVHGHCVTALRDAFRTSRSRRHAPRGRGSVAAAESSSKTAKMARR